TVRWSKAANADGYVIYRSTRKKSGYKLIKTIKSGNTVSFVNKKLAKGKKYYYKVRAYRTVGDKNIYGSYSAVKYKKAK
ncbi:MAG: fibronectin type III domain-containing protein, partial [Mogibacterium sp.]|nr:fibronectin type III domain-containing protein [Mogibacterium sp.]